MGNIKRLLEIDSCNRCSSLDIANSGICGYYLCRKENRVIELCDKRIVNIVMGNIDIPDWCSLPVANGEITMDNKGE